MSWLARSIANSFRLENNSDADGLCAASTSGPQSINDDHRIHGNEDEEEEDRFDGRGMKEDLSEFKDTITRQLWGVASFIAPPPQPPSLPTPQPRINVNVRTDPDRLFLSDLKPWDPWERSVQWALGDFSDDVDDKVSISNSGADSCFRSEFGGVSGDEIGNAAGVTEEVLAFAKNIAHHPETWLDFPLSEEEDLDDFDMSKAQKEHAMAVECLTPGLAALRIELCPAHMSVGFFWMVYFVLLHSRLNKHDAELLSTQKIVQARSMWMQELQKQTKPEPDWFGRSTFYSKEGFHEAFDHGSSDDVFSDMSPRKSAWEAIIETEKHPLVSTEMQIIDKSVIEEEQVTNTRDKELKTSPSYKLQIQDFGDEGDDWIKEHLELDGYSGNVLFPGNEEDVSFSDLEDDIDCIMPIKSKNILEHLATSTKTL